MPNRMKKATIDTCHTYLLGDPLEAFPDDGFLDSRFGMAPPASDHGWYDYRP